MNITLEQLAYIYPQSSAKNRATFLPFLNATMKEFGIDSKARTAAFLAQVGHESGQLIYVKELASGAAYEGRHDLGNTEEGDGVRFKGRGLIQITGRANYVAVGKALNIDVMITPALLEYPENATRSAGWFWSTHHLNDYVDKGDFVTLTKRINGGTTGLTDRMMLWERAKTILPEPTSESADEQKPAQA